ncbi:FAD-dependent monooxygenase [Saccharothrix australiensis]|uniref:2-polyprenyl-6-methoxyphenol hydroxylase-like FAD-dependent oxidoreductase n=1 Tax=Saccharothrix australiensis TaxID=2072 RepID=A0A495VW30_9PSEU|nr:FAD-dependent monooxygenase [Saccharothrix australiensis]RKT53592.1 2-polyprenyl-6-methoxyphenol hydroxylase-like FAD-dependent oxidoreductase [Saccharothrix australiensis]
MTTTTPTTETTPVLVVGGSLVGLSAAVFLAWHDVPLVVVEKHQGSSPHPRAIGYTTRTLELFRQVGIEVPRSAQGSGTPRRARVESLAGKWIEEYPWSPGGGPKPRVTYSPVGATAIAQDELEPILRDRARDLGADLRLGTELIRFTQDDDGVSATLRRRGDGHEHGIRAQYVIAADGATSPIREALGIGREGEGLLSVQRSILFTAPIDHYLEKGVVQFEIAQPDLQVFLTTYSDGRWVLMLGDDVDRTEDEQKTLVRQAVGIPDLPVELITTGRFELAALIAKRFSAGRVFLAGDAAHQLPPNRGGFGANTGIDDAHNLAWKLAAVLSGQSDPRLLDTYDAERRPIAELRHEQIFARADYKGYLTTPRSDVPVLDDNAIELGQLYRSDAVAGAGPELPPAQRPDEWAGQPGTRAPHLPITTTDGRGTSTLDLFGRGWVLLSQDPRWAPATQQTADHLGLPVRFVHVGAEVDTTDPHAFPTAFGTGPQGATLVRPDGYIAWRTTDVPVSPAETLTDVLARVAAAG